MVLADLDRLVGRQGPITPAGQAGKAQTSTPSGTPTGTSRSMSIGQGNLPHRKETTSNSRMQRVSREQPCCHSLCKWRKRTTLQHRHAGMSTGSETCTLRGISSEGAWALMRRPSPSPEEGPVAQPHIGPTPNMIVSEFSFCIHYQRVLHQPVQCVLLRRGQIPVTGKYP